MPRPRPPQEASSPKPALPRKLCGPQVHPLRVCSLPSAHTGPCLRPLGAQRTGRGPAARGPALGAGGRLPLWTRPGLPCTAVGTARGTHTAVPWATWAPPSCCSTQSAASPRRRPHALPGAAALWPPERLSWGRAAASHRGSVCASRRVGPPRESPIRGRVAAFPSFCCRVRVPALVTREAGRAPPALQAPLHSRTTVSAKHRALGFDEVHVGRFLLVAPIFGAVARDSMPNPRP